MEKVTTHVGLDVHAERVVIASLVGQAGEPVVADIPNDEKVIRRTFQRLARESYELKCCYEAGPCGFELHRQLTAMGIAQEADSEPREVMDRYAYIGWWREGLA
jgi:transposase